MFDMIVIGAGPAGLAAAIRGADLGLDILVVERLTEPGLLSHPCGGAMAPLPGFVSGRRSGDGGVFFPELDLTVPAEAILGWPDTIRYLSPGGYAMRAEFPIREDFPVFVADKSALLRRMAERATSAGVTLRFGQRVTGLVESQGGIRGIRLGDRERLGFMVVGAEGVSRQFASEAGLYRGIPPAAQTVMVAYQSLDAPHVSAADVGQLFTFGQRYTQAEKALGTVDIPAPGRLDVYFSVFVDRTTSARIPLWDYLEAYKHADPRVRHLFRDAVVWGQRACRMPLRGAPSRVVVDGFLGVGDAVSPGGHLGIVASMFLGVRAAETAAKALQTGQVTETQLTPYNQLFTGRFLRGVEMESKLLQGLANLDDEEIDRLCQNMGRINIAPFFLGKPGPILGTSLLWLLRSFPFILRDWSLLRRIF
jgi:flavin-dependent dehydrogenase